MGSGACFTGANPGWKAKELAYHLQQTGAKFVLTEVGTLDIAIAAAEERGTPQNDIFALNYKGEGVPEKKNRE